MTTQEGEIIEAMKKYGGSFVHALSTCFLFADSDNFKKLRHAFPEYWEEYREMVERTKV